MTKSITLFFLLTFVIVCACNGQQKIDPMENKTNNPLLCNPETGVCAIPETQNALNHEIDSEQTKSIKIIYFTDPICSSCWGIEPQLRKLKLEYGNNIEIEYRMGGLLPDWSYNSGGISKPSDVAHHWDEVSAYYNMPIDGDIWLEDPLDSSYPPSIAFKAAQMQDKKKAMEFMRRLREMVFLEKKNITQWKHMETAAIETGLDNKQLKVDFENKATQLFNEDLALSKKMGVRGFPTLFVVDTLNKVQIIYGFRPYSEFENAVLKTDPAATKKDYDHSWNNLFDHYPSLTLREFSELSGLTKIESEKLLQQLVIKGELTMLSSKNGSIWRINKAKH